MTSLKARVYEQTAPFLAALLRCTQSEAVRTPLTWQVFPDDKQRSQDGLTKILHGTFQELVHTLDELNKQGAGVFLTVNATDLKGRSKANIQQVRACWADLDDKGATTAFDGHSSLPLAPTMKVQSGHGTHLYWVLRDPLEASPENQRLQEQALKGIQNTLVSFGADPAVCEIARVMRVPGFFNQKAEPYPLVSLVLHKGPQYALTDIARAFPVIRTTTTARTHKSADFVEAGPLSGQERVALASRYLESCPPAISGENGHNMTFKVVCNLGPGFDLNEETTLQLLLEVYNPRCEPEWSEAELRHKVNDAFTKESRRGWMLPGQGVESTRPTFGAYQLTGAGLFRREILAEKPELIKVSDPFEVLAEIRDKSSSGWGLLVRWEDRDGVVHSRRIPREALVGEGADVIRLFLGEGLSIHHRKFFLEYLSRVQTPSRARSIEHIGWNGPVYVLPDENFGDMPELIYLDSPSRDHSFSTKGDLLGWRLQVARYGRGNSRLAFAISVGFSGALLGPLGMESGGFNFFGPSSTGKTTCAQVAGSVWGGPRFCETWRATSNGLESTAVAHNDSLLVLDEQGQADPKECGEIVYMLANGMDKVRSSKTLEHRPRRRWRVTLLSTGEVTLADKMRDVGGKAKPGQSVRLLDIPICPKGKYQVFEDTQNKESTKALADHLKNAVQENYGTPIREFLRCLTALPPEAIGHIRERVRKWEKDNVPMGADSQVTRAASRFAVAAVAGELAQVWRIVPWSAREADAAAQACFRAWLNHRGGIHSGERQEGIHAVLDFIDCHGQSRFADPEDQEEKVIQRVGWRKPSMDGVHIDYMFTSGGWQEACKGFQAKDVAAAMRKAGLLDAPHGPMSMKTQKKVRIRQGTHWLYVVLGSAIAAYRERETHESDVFHLGAAGLGGGTGANPRVFFSEFWMFPSSDCSISGSRMTLAGRLHLRLGGRIVDPGDDDLLNPVVD